MKNQNCIKANCYNPPVDWISGLCEEHEQQETDPKRIELWETYREHFKNLKGTPWITSTKHSQ